MVASQCPNKHGDVLKPIVESNKYFQRVSIDEYLAIYYNGNNGGAYLEKGYSIYLRVFPPACQSVLKLRALRLILDGLIDIEFDVSDFRKCCAVLPCRCQG